MISPDVLKTTFWDDLADGFPTTRYLPVRKSRYHMSVAWRVWPERECRYLSVIG